MSPKLPSTLASYFAATNQRDVDEMLAVFADGAVVKDEGQEHRGLTAIRSWMKDAIGKYDFRTEPTAFLRTDGESVVTARVSGDFPGSPVTLSHRFTLDGQKIARLEIS